MRTIRNAALTAAVVLCAQVQSALGAAVPIAHGMPRRPPAAAALAPVQRPWDEGVTPALESRVFAQTYKTLPSHNVLKVYVFDGGGYQSAGIRFSARVPHEQRDLTRSELDAEATTLIRTTFDNFPDVQTLDVWGTIPVSAIQMTRVDSTVFSVSADRPTYESVRDKQLTDEEFLDAFGRVWMAPEVPQ